MFHAGRRLVKVLAELEREKDIPRKDLAKYMGISYNMLTKYYHMESFSPTVLNNLMLLEDYGVNPDFFSDETAAMWLPEPEKGEEEILEKMFKLIQEQNEMIKALVQRLEK